jgi:hypothetical protein
VTVTRQRTDLQPAQLTGPAPHRDAVAAGRCAVRGAFRVQFHATGFNVSHAGPKLPETGHFRLTMDRAGAKPEVLDLQDGQTEAWLEPPAGDYVLKLDLVANDSGAVLASAAPARVRADRFPTAPQPARKASAGAP